MKSIVRSLAALALFAAPTFAADVPEPVVGSWIATNISATTYWRDDGRFLGNGSGSAQYYTFNADGTFKYFMYLEVRTGAFVSKVNTSCEGTVKWQAHKFTLHPVKGHYHTETGSTIKDREMTEEDLTRHSKSYAWKTGRTNDGKPTIVIPFDDGSKFEFKPADAPPKNVKR